MRLINCFVKEVIIRKEFVHYSLLKSHISISCVLVEAELILVAFVLVVVVVRHGHCLERISFCLLFLVPWV